MLQEGEFSIYFHKNLLAFVWVWILGEIFLGLRCINFGILRGVGGSGLLFLLGLSWGRIFRVFFSLPLEGVWRSSRVFISFFLGVNFLVFIDGGATFSGNFGNFSCIFRHGGSSGVGGLSFGVSRVLIFSRILGLGILVGLETGAGVSGVSSGPFRGVLTVGRGRLGCVWTQSLWPGSTAILGLRGGCGHDLVRVFISGLAWHSGGGWHMWAASLGSPSTCGGLGLAAQGVASALRGGCGRM